LRGVPSKALRASANAKERLNSSNRAYS
jgi:hypothetical protein